MSALIEMAQLDAKLRDSSYVNGWAFSEEDKKVYSSLSVVPTPATYPHAYRWYKHVTTLLSKPTAALPKSAPKVVAPTAPTVPTGALVPAFAQGVGYASEPRGVPKDCLPNVSVSFAADVDAAATRKEGKGKGQKVNLKPAGEAPADDMNGDDLFGDDDMGGDDLFADDGAEEAPAMSLADKAKAAKEKAKKKKKDKVEKSQVVIEVKPWEADQNLDDLYKKICSTIVVDGLQWGEAYNLEEVGYGIKKLVMSCVIEDDKVLTDDFLEPIGEMEDDVQSVDMLTMNRL